MEEFFKALLDLVNRVKDLERIRTTPTITYTNVTYTNSWVDFGSSNHPVGYYRDMLGFVHLRGLAKSGTVNTAMFTLPAGYQPTKELRFVVISNGALGYLTISNAGVVTLVTGNNTYVSLEGIIFQAEQ